MSLLKPLGGPGFVHCTDNSSGTPAVILGTSITAGANNVDGTAVTLLSALAHDCEYLRIGISSIAASAANGSALLDILFDPAGGTSWTELIPDLLAGYTQIISGAQMPNQYDFPLWIPAGSSIGARVKTARSSNIAGGRVAVQVYGGSMRPDMWWCGQTVTNIGIDAANSIGQAHTSGNTGAFSSWTNLGSTSSYDAGAVQFAAQGVGAGAAATSLVYRFEYGVSGNRIGPSLTRQIINNESGNNAMDSGPIFCSLPAGTQLQVRGTCSGTAEAIDVAAYLVH